MVEVIQSETFSKWFGKLSDRQAKARIEARIARMRAGLTGDAKRVGKGVSEMRIDHGPGYRVYFITQGPVIVVLLCGGTKRTQQADIQHAIKMAKDWR